MSAGRTQPPGLPESPADPVARARGRRLGRVVVGTAAALLVAAGCGDAVDPDDRPVPEAPTFSADVAEILYRECTPCHQTGGAGPFPLESFEDARLHAALIARVTGERRMPPWLPEPTDFPFADERRLSDREIEILRRWADQGAPAGDPDRAPDPPEVAEGWILGEPDLVLQMPEAYTVPASAHGEDFHTAHEDVYRNFVIPVPVEETRYVRAVEFQPDDARVVHHAIMSLDHTPSSRQEDARDPEPGFDGMFTGTAAEPPGGFFLGWTPGWVPRPNPEGLAWPLDPGADFVIQTHFRPIQEPVDVRLRVGFHFTDAPPQREAVVMYLLGKGIDIPPGESAYVVEDRFEIPVDVEVLGLYPHAHYVGRTMEAWAELPDGTRYTLLRIPEWDFNWQDVYPFEEPVPLPAGTVVRKRFVYDNSAENPRNPHDPPQRVTFGRNSTDEMAELWLQAVPRNPEDFETLETAMTEKGLQDHLEMWLHLVELDPEDPVAHANLASVYDSHGRMDRSVQHYRRAVELEPELELAHFNLATILEERGDVEGAMHHYREAIRAFPEYATAHNRLGNLHYYQDRFDEAEEHYRRAIEIDPERAEVHVNLGNLERERGRLREALDHYHRAVEVAPRSGEIRFNLVYNLVLMGAPDEALEHLDEAIRLAPRDLQARLGVAWMLATHPEGSLRRPWAALEVAEGVRDSLTGDHPLVLDVIAAAHAAAGRFDRAQEIAGEARELASERGEEQLAREIGQRLELYRQGRPFTAAPG